MDNRPIGIMDSGIGGLTVARVLHETYPEEGIVFLGDTKRNPYGERSRDDIVRFSFAIKDFLKEHQVKMILIACNTISFNVPPAFFEEDIPVIKMSMEVKLPEDAKHFAVFATPATIATHAHKAYFQKNTRSWILWRFPATDWRRRSKEMRTKIPFLPLSNRRQRSIMH